MCLPASVRVSRAVCVSVFASVGHVLWNAHAFMCLECSGHRVLYVDRVLGEWFESGRVICE